MSIGVGYAELLKQHLRRDASAISPMALEFHTKLVDCDQPLEKPPLALGLGKLARLGNRILSRLPSVSPCHCLPVCGSQPTSSAVQPVP